MKINLPPTAMIGPLLRLIGPAPRDAAEAEDPPTTTPPGPGGGGITLGSAAMLVALGAADPSRERRLRDARPLSRALDLLDQLIEAEDDPASTAELAAWLDGHRAPTDPRLARLDADIALRVAVELARRDARR